MTSATGMDDEAKAALADPAEVTFSVVGRNGHRVDYRVAVRDWERGTISYDMGQDRRTFDVFDAGDQAYTEPIPHHRRFSFTLDASVPGIRQE